MTLTGVGPVVATALAASIGDPRHFKSGREMAAWIGLVPRQYSTGGKSRLGKPAPDMLLRALDQPGAEPCDAAMVGDSRVDIEAAHRAGLPLVFVLNGYMKAPRRLPKPI
jgi:transposase